MPWGTSGDPGKAGEQHAANDDIVEMRHQEKTVVQLEIGRRNREQNAGHAADDEGDDESTDQSIGVA